MRRVFSLFLFFFCAEIGLVFSFNAKQDTRIDTTIKKDVNPAYSSYLKGLLSDRYGEPKRALEEYIKAEKFDQESTSLKLRVAVQYIRLNNLGKAIKLLDELKKEKPLNLDAYLLLILIYSNQKEEEKANQEYEEMLSRLYKEKPGNLKIAESLAQFKLQKKDYDSALSIYKNILKINPKYIDAYFWVGYLYEEKGERLKAIEAWKRTLELNPNYSDALNSLGYVYAEEGKNLDEAEVLIKKALKIKPDSPAYLDSLGWVYFKKEDYLKAKEYIEKAASFLKDPVILEHLGDVYSKLGEFKKAREVWSEVLKIEPENKVIQKKIESIKDEISASKN